MTSIKNIITNYDEIVSYLAKEVWQESGNLTNSILWQKKKKKKEQLIFKLLELFYVGQINK